MERCHEMLYFFISTIWTDQSLTKPALSRSLHHRNGKLVLRDDEGPGDPFLSIAGKVADVQSLITAVATYAVNPKGPDIYLHPVKSHGNLVF